LHDNNIKSFYAHLDSFNCKKNDFVATGQIIGYVGLTGLTTGPHLHFEIYYSGETKDPWEIIN
jgi:murein DD-endopeptidase MepM/ murein hydrolase activator NlpD